jgi:hypothetical protein
MGICVKCQKEIPDWYTPQLCDVCLNKKINALYIQSDSEITSDAYTINQFSTETVDTTYEGADVSLAVDKDNFNGISSKYVLTLEDIVFLLKSQSQAHSTLLSILEERSSSLITGELFFGETASLANTIKEIIQNKKVVWKKAFEN